MRTINLVHNNMKSFFANEICFFQFVYVYLKTFCYLWGITLKASHLLSHIIVVVCMCHSTTFVFVIG